MNWFSFLSRFGAVITGVPPPFRLSEAMYCSNHPEGLGGGVGGVGCWGFTNFPPWLIIPTI